MGQTRTPSFEGSSGIGMASPEDGDEPEDPTQGDPNDDEDDDEADEDDDEEE